jgi:hypothetical protein
MAAMNGCRVLMAGMGLGNGRRERKHDQDDRRSQNSHGQLLWHDRLVVAQVPLDIAGAPGIQGPLREPGRRHRALSGAGIRCFRHSAPMRSIEPGIHQAARAYDAQLRIVELRSTIPAQAAAYDAIVNWFQRCDAPRSRRLCMAPIDVFTASSERKKSLQRRHFLDCGSWLSNASGLSSWRTCDAWRSCNSILPWNV